MIKAIKGTKDILPTEIESWYKVEKIVKDVFNNFNYREIRTPVFEETGLFARGIGEATDIVSKEMYTFLDRSETSITLRPEMTASVVRALLEHSLDKQSSLNKLFYIAPMFRQERPQAGRLRQFHQFGAEALGSNNPSLDAEMIIMAYSILKNIGLKNLTVKINSLGVPASREEYKNILKDYLKDKFGNLSEESKKRFELNILRLFDSKDEKDIEIMKDAPLLLDYLDEESLEHFNKVKSLLDKAGVPYEVDARLVRGLDYYTNTTFEILSSSVGSQSALCGGGRYNLLVNQLGQRDVPAVGFAAGIERILLACANEGLLDGIEKKIDLYIVRLDKNLEEEAFELAYNLRKNGFVVELDYLSRSIKAQMREANKLGASFTLLLGGEEYENGKLLLKNMSDSTQEDIPFNDFDLLLKKLGK